MKRVALILLAAAVSCGCYRPAIKYVEFDPSAPFVMNSWYKMGDTYWFSTPSQELAKAEYSRVTGHSPDTIPFSMYGFYLWTDGTGMFYVTQSHKTYNEN